MRVFGCLLVYERDGQCVEEGVRAMWRRGPGTQNEPRKAWEQ